MEVQSTLQPFDDTHANARTHTASSRAFSPNLLRGMMDKNEAPSANSAPFNQVLIFFFFFNSFDRLSLKISGCILSLLLHLSSSEITP